MMADKLSLDELLEAELHDDNLISKSGREILESQYVLWVAGIMSKYDQDEPKLVIIDKSW